jgi:hypothetical protein
MNGKVVSAASLILGWSFVLGMLVRASGHSPCPTFLTIYLGIYRFTSVLFVILLAYSIPAVFVIAWVEGRISLPKKRPQKSAEWARPERKLRAAGRDEARAGAQKLANEDNDWGRSIMLKLAKGSLRWNDVFCIPHCADRCRHW